MSQRMLVRVWMRCGVSADARRVRAAFCRIGRDEDESPFIMKCDRAAGTVLISRRGLLLL